MRNRSSVGDLLVMAPWWISAGLAVLSFTALRWLLPGLVGPNAFVRALADGGARLAWFPALFFGLLSVASLVLRKKKAALVDLQQDLESLRGLGWKEFEWLVGEAYRRQGYVIDESLGGGPDGGVDVALRRNGETTLVQCKQWRAKSVGVPVVRELFGVMTAEKAQHAVVITSGDFTREASAFAEGKPITLVDGPHLLELVRAVQRRPSTETEMLVEQRSSSIPTCPRCGNPMVLRTAKRGAKAGKSFWGCSTYPACTGTVDAG